MTKQFSKQGLKLNLHILMTKASLNARWKPLTQVELKRHILESVKSVFVRRVLLTNDPSCVCFHFLMQTNKCASSVVTGADESGW